jgi:hypothetical protein
MHYQTQLKKCFKMMYNITLFWNRFYFQTQLKKCFKMTYNITIFCNRLHFQTQLKNCFKMMYIITIICNGSHFQTQLKNILKRRITSPYSVINEWFGNSQNSRSQNSGNNSQEFKFYLNSFILAGEFPEFPRNQWRTIKTSFIWELVLFFQWI